MTKLLAALLLASVGVQPLPPCGPTECRPGVTAAACDGQHCRMSDGTYRFDPRNGLRVVATCTDGFTWKAHGDVHRFACAGHHGVASWTDGKPVRHYTRKAK